MVTVALRAGLIFLRVSLHALVILQFVVCFQVVE